MKSAATALSTIFALLLFDPVYLEAKTVISVDDVGQFVRVDVDLSRVARRVDERFLSVAIDASLLTEEKFMNLLNSPKLRTLAKALTPAFLRFGGTKQDFLKFSPRGRYYLQGRENGSSAFQGNVCMRLELPPLLENRLKQEWVQQSKSLLLKELDGKYRNTKFSEDSVDLLYSFANCSGLELIFGLNALLRTSRNCWDSGNAKLLLKYCESRQYMMSWELGNEPNSYEKKAGVRVDGFQLGRDFMHLHQILQESTIYNSTGLYGPDVSQPKDHRKDLLTGFLETGGKVINACTWHHYYVNGRDTSLEDFLDPEVLDSLATKINEVLEMVEAVSPGKKVWLGETSSAYGGGAVGLSDTFVAGFMWLDKLGLAAKLGLNLVIRQVLIGAGTYHLVDDNLDPLPDYWLSLLFKRLVGQEVLKADVTVNSGLKKPIRVYLHCTNKKSTQYKEGAVTLFALNLNKNEATINLPAHLTNGSIEAFVLQSDEAGEQGLYSRSVRLNGELLKMVDDRTLPPLTGRELPSDEPIKLPAFSFAFYVLINAQAAVCK
ncbi:heparanase precursor [Danio rerio]|uniref:Heparanase n=1 Tax=Danio rerio TaxID=7955 RepID=Q1LVP9_DANRE|nr:heparanase precursor [Danio rerio]|eukprot:NP_001038470.1 heparanase precursor [Danio rerio]